MENVKVLLKERKNINNPSVDKSYDKQSSDDLKPLFRPQPAADFVPKSEDILANKRNMLIRDSGSQVTKQVERLASLQRYASNQESQTSETESQKALNLPIIRPRHLVN